MIYWSTELTLSALNVNVLHPFKMTIADISESTSFFQCWWVGDVIMTTVVESVSKVTFQRVTKEQHVNTRDLCVCM